MRSERAPGGRSSVCGVMDCGLEQGIQLLCRQNVGQPISTQVTFREDSVVFSSHKNKTTEKSDEVPTGSAIPEGQLRFQYPERPSFDERSPNQVG